MTDARKALIRRLETATRGSRELDEEIAAVISGAILERQPNDRVAYHKDDMWVSVGEIKPWTTSIDAALTLVPESYVTEFIIGNGSSVNLWSRSSPFQQMIKSGKLSTPALALCNAVLKALDA